jgi:hypothetical protein
MAHETSNYPTFRNSSHHTHSSQHLKVFNIDNRVSPVGESNLAEPHLIDDLFAEVENLLGQHSIPLQAWNKKVQTQIPTVLPITSTSQTSELTIRPSLSNLSGWPIKPESSNKSLLLVSEKKNSDSCNSPSHIPLSPKIAIVILCGSIATISAVWLTYRISSAINTSQTTAVTNLQPENTQTAQNKEFANYVQRALAAIDRQPETTKLPAFNQPTFNSLKSLNPSSFNPAPITNILSKVKKSTSTDKSDTSFSKTPIIINVPTIQTTPTSDDPRQELKQVLNRLSNVLEKLDRTTTQNLALRPTAQPRPIATASKPDLQRTLKGIVIASDNTQSAVLFEINGITQRYYTGESMGSSGWKITDISGNYVSLQRNGEVRSLFVGQKI